MELGAESRLGDHPTHEITTQIWTLIFTQLNGMIERTQLYLARRLQVKRNLERREGLDSSLQAHCNAMWSGGELEISRLRADREN